MALNSSSNETQCSPEAQHASLTVLLCLVYLMGLILNSFSLFIFTFRMSKWNTGMVLQFNLALSDAVASPATPMVAVYLIKGDTWEFSSFACPLKIALISAHVYGSTIFLTLISIHRYVVVVGFNRSSPLKRKDFVKKLCIGVWCFLLLIVLILGVLLPATQEDGHKQCLSIHQRDFTDVYFVINFLLFVFGFTVPFSISSICYSHLARSVSQINVNSPQGQKIRTKSLKMIGICLIIFGLCFLPLNVVRTVAVVVKKYFPEQCALLLRLETAYYASYVLSGVNCSLDPLIYFFGSRSFSTTLRRSLRMLRIPQERDNRSESDTVSYNVNRPSVYAVST